MVTNFGKFVHHGWAQVATTAMSGVGGQVAVCLVIGVFACMHLTPSAASTPRRSPSHLRTFIHMQSDSAQPLLRNIYKLDRLLYKPDTRKSYERSLNDHLRPGPTGRPWSMYAPNSARGREGSEKSTLSSAVTPRPLTMVQSRPSSAHHLATKGQRLALIMQDTVRPRSGSGLCLFMCTPFCDVGWDLLEGLRLHCSTNTLILSPGLIVQTSVGSSLFPAPRRAARCSMPTKSGSSLPRCSLRAEARPAPASEKQKLDHQEPAQPLRARSLPR